MTATEELDSAGLPVYNVDFSCIFLNKRRAWTLEEYAAMLSGVTPGSGRHISHNEIRDYPPILEREPYKSRYGFHLKDLKLAASTGQLRVSKDIFSERPFEYLCLPDDFLEWAEENNLEIYSQYMTLDQNINKRQTENVDNANSNPIQAIPMDWRDLKTLTIKQFVGFKCAVPSDYADNPDSDPMLKMMIEAVTQSLVAGVFAGDIRTTEPYGLIVEQRKLSM